MHMLVEGRPLVLGGIEIPHGRGLLGHSDADVLLHAICDAMIGAAALGDIGTHFPDTSLEFKNISSMVLLRRTADLIGERGLRLANIDSTIVAQRPRLCAFIPQMVEKISNLLGSAPGSSQYQSQNDRDARVCGPRRGGSPHMRSHSSRNP